MEFEATTLKINHPVKSNMVILDENQVATEKKMDEKESTSMAIDLGKCLGHIPVVEDFVLNTLKKPMAMDTSGTTVVGDNDSPKENESHSKKRERRI
ncbi:hypothetical protein V6N13_059096 [Hibiscus sabdariffa]